MKHGFRDSMKDVQTLPGAGVDCAHTSLVAKICSSLEKLHAQRQGVQDALEEKLGAIECVSAVEQYQETCV